jgi:uncharacterized membrane protein HdeD (DUF308 family)
MTNRYWGALLALGIILVIIGILAISSPFFTTLATVFALGWLLIISGIAQLIYTFSIRKSGSFLEYALIGLFTLLVGILMIANPTSTAKALTLLLGAFFLAIGLFRILGAIVLRFANWGWVLVSGILAVILGILILIHWPVTALWVIGLFIGIDLLFTGLSFITASFTVKKLES